MTETDKILQIAVAAAQKAGKLQLENFRSSFSVENKSTSVDMVTDIDKKSEEIIRNEIYHVYPEHIIYGEESGRSAGKSNYTWVIDPLDGTTNFVHGLPVFAVSVAVFYKEEPLVGVVHVPPLETTYTAIEGKGAFRNSTPIHASNRDTLGHALLATGIPYDRATSPHNNIDYFSCLARKVRGIRRLGAAAYDLCLVAEGVYDGYWELKVELWDIAAGHIICREAGAESRYTTFENKINVVAANKHIYPALCRELCSVNRDFAPICNI